MIKFEPIMNVDVKLITWLLAAYPCEDFLPTIALAQNKLKQSRGTNNAVLALDPWLNQNV